MVDGIQLSLLIGTGSPQPAPRKMMEALRTVEVVATSHGVSGFQMQFAVSNDSDLRKSFMLPGGAVPPMVRVIIAVTVNGTVDVLMDGVMTHHELVPAGKGQTLSVTGEDLTRVMDYADTSGKAYPATSPETRAQMILSKYATLGVTPQIVSTGTNDTPTANEHVPRHQGKDLGYLRTLAEQAGHVFYLEPGPTIGRSVAYWGPEIRPGQPQPALNVNFGARTNVESMTFAFDSESASKAQGYVQDPSSKETSAVAGDKLGSVPQLGNAQLLRKRDEPKHDMSKYTPGRAAQAQKASTSTSEHGVIGTGKLDVVRYGRVLKARRLVGARGGGEAFDGIYHVRSVTHHIVRGSYSQDFTLVRNGLVSTTQSLPP
jgi:hypothetical protein